MIIIKILIGILSIGLLLIFAGCANDKPKSESTTLTTIKESVAETAVYKSITAQEAKKIIDEKTDYIILDVRTDSEFIEGHIDGAILIPDYEISAKAEQTLTDKNKLILVYCRSGRRSANAARELISLGYTNVLDFGGIISWPYEIVK